MRLITTDGNRNVNIGSYEIWHCLYSTVAVKLKDYMNTAPKAFLFLKSGECRSDQAMETAREINLVRDGLAEVSPDDAVYDIDNMDKVAPWKGKLSPVITSCNTMFTTSDGKDLLYEIVSILCYAGIKKVDVEIQ